MSLKLTKVEQTRH